MLNLHDNSGYCYLKDLSTISVFRLPGSIRNHLLKSVAHASSNTDEAVGEAFFLSQLHESLYNTPTYMCFLLAHSVNHVLIWNLL